MKSRTNLFIFLICCLLFGMACRDSEQGAEFVCLSDWSDISAAGGVYELEVQAAGEWEILLSDRQVEWCKLNPCRGIGKESVKVTIIPNYGGERKVTLILQGGSSEDVLLIVQGEHREDNSGVVAGRLEIPRLMGTNRYKFVEHDVVWRGQVVHNYCMEYDLAKRHARWVAFTAYEGIAEDHVARSEAWADDPEIPFEYRATKLDYVGYDRGHLVASNDRRYCREANEQTFFYSNMSPQLAYFNREIWQKLEENVKAWMQDVNLRDTLYVVKGGTIADGQIIETIGEHYLVVPRYFFMAVLARKKNVYQSIAFWLEHKAYKSPYRLQEKAISVDELEEKTGIDFFPALTDSIEYKVEAVIDINNWDWVNL